MEKEKNKKEEKIKEEKIKEEKVKDYSIEPKHQKNFRRICKAIYVVATILKVFTIIGIVGIVIGMITIPILSSNIKVNAKDEIKNVEIFGHKINYIREEKSIIIYEEEKENDKTEITDKSDVKTLNEIIDYIEENDLTKMSLLLEFELAVSIGALVVTYITLKKTYLLFKNMYSKETPFIKENVELLTSISKLLIASLIISVVLSSINSFIFDTSDTYSITSVVEILIVYCAIYIFEYGIKMQKETKGKIYSQE